MKYFALNLGDWSVATRFLSPEQKGIYLDLLVQYIGQEAPISDDQLVCIRFAYAKEMHKSLDLVLRLFFVHEGDVYRSEYADRVIAECRKAAETSEKRKKAANARWNNGLRNSEASETAEKSVQNGCNSQEFASDLHMQNGCKNDVTNNHKPITVNQIKEKKEKKALRVSFCPVEVASGEVPSQTWDDWMTVRRAKRAPMTETAWERFKSEAEKAHLTLKDAVAMCATRGWSSFLASWLADDRRTLAEETEEERHARNERLAAEWAREQGYE